jgi:hypothetical protein
MMKNTIATFSSINYVNGLNNASDWINASIPMAQPTRLSDEGLGTLPTKNSSTNWSTTSSSNSVSFSSIKNLSNNTGDSRSPMLEASAGTVYAVWDDTSNGNQEIYFKRSTDSGNHFDKTINLSSDDGASSQPEIAKFGNYVYIVWADRTTGSSDIYFKRSTDSGNHFDKTINLSSDQRVSAQPKIFAAMHNVFVVWRSCDDNEEAESCQILFRASMTGGSSFANVMTISNNTKISNHPQVSAVSTNVYVVWEDDSEGKDDIFFRASTDGGNHFDSIKNLSNNIGESYLAATNSIAAVSTNVYVVWEDDSEGKDDIFFRASTDGGNHFDSIKNLSNNNGSSQNPILAGIANDVYVIWSDNTPSNLDVFFKRSTDGGNHFDSIKNLSNNTGESFEQKISISGEAVYILWKDLIPGTNKDDIFFRASTDGGNHFDSIKNLSNNIGVSESAQVVASHYSVFVIWEDNSPRPGNFFEIFFRRGTG